MSKNIAGRATAMCAVIAIAALISSADAEARSRTVTGRGGGTWTRTVTPYNNGGGNFGRTITTARPDGASASRSFDRSISNGTITDSRTTTGFNGAMSSTTLTRTPGEGGSLTHTGRGGQTYTRSVTHD